MISYLSPIVYMLTMSIICFIIPNIFYALLLTHLFLFLFYYNNLGIDYLKTKIFTLITPKKSSINILLFVVFILTLHLCLVQPLTSGLYGMSVLQTCLLSYTIAPFFEEFIFRGVFQTKLNDKFKNIKFGNILSVIITSIFFMGAHLSYYGYIHKLAGIFLFSCLLGYFRNKYKSIFPPILVHMLNNILAT